MEHWDALPASELGRSAVEVLFLLSKTGLHYQNMYGGTWCIKAQNFLLKNRECSVYNSICIEGERNLSRICLHTQI